MKLRSKLSILLLVCGIAPMTAAVSVAYFSSRNTTKNLVEHASVALQKNAESKLEGQIAGRGAHVRSYFESIEKHVVTMAVDEGVAEAMQQFATTFGQIREDNGFEADKVAELSRQQTAYYRSDFAAEYGRQNKGVNAPVDRMLTRVDAPMLVAQYLYQASNPNPLGKKDLLDKAGDRSRYTEVHARFHPWLHQFQQSFGYYDVFLIDLSGRVVYTVFKELDFGSSLTDGPWSTTALGELYRRVQMTPTGSFAFSDFAQYTPSYDAPAAFIGSPVVHDGERLGYIVFQMPIDRINAIMTSADGLGTSGEIMLVGADRHMRSDSRQNPETLSVDASYRHPETGKLDLPVVAQAIDKGESGVAELTDKDGDAEICAFAPLDALGQRWCVLGKINKDEVFAAAVEMAASGENATASMLTWNAGLVLITSLLVAGVAWWFSRQLTAPIDRTVIALKDIAEGEGDLTRRIDEARADELGEMGKWFNRFLARLQGTIKDLGTKAQSVTSASTQLMATAASLASGADRTKAQSTQVAAAAEQMTANMNNVSTSSDSMAGTLRTVAAAVEQMTASIGEVAKSADGAARVAGQAADLTRTSNQKVSLLGDAANEIGRVIETIQDIAEQTNLLALNATIEAARAGEAGKGFSVVANEVKDLARQTAEATQDIRQRIERIQSSTQESVGAIVEIDKVIAQVSAASQAIATAVGEQRTATQEIAQNLAENTRTVEVVNRNVAECVTTSREISRSIQDVDQNARTTSIGADETEQAGKGLGSLAHELQSLVMQFRV